MKKYQILFLALYAIPLPNFAQSSFQLRILPSLNINKKLPRDWSVNFKTESRQSLYREDFDYDYLLTDFSMAVAKKTGISTSFVAGYLLRVAEEGLINRTIQQMNIIRRYVGFRVAHRISADQTFQEISDSEFRLRYRASAEIPLNGQSLDPKEFFLKLNNEYLNELYKGAYDLEIRGATYIGYTITPANKMELGIDYRWDSFVTGSPRHRIFIGLNFYQSI